MQDEVFVFPFIKGSDKIVLVAENFEEAQNMVFDTAQHGEMIVPVTYCELDWNKKVMQGLPVTMH